MCSQLTKKLQSTINKLSPLAALAVVIMVWFGVSESELVPGFLLPTPAAVGTAFVSDFPLLLTHAKTTLQEAFYGLLIGIGFAFVMAWAMDRFHLIRQAIYPLLVLSQTIPTIAVAPLLVLWMGFGMAPKITLVVMTTFFPITIGLLNGFESVDRDAVNLLRSMGAKRWQIFKIIKLPSSTGYFFSGLKVSASYAVVSAVVAEWLGGFDGLGVYMIRVKKAYAFDKMFAVIVFISAVSLLLMLLVTLLQKTAMPWERQQSKQPIESKTGVETSS